MTVDCAVHVLFQKNLTNNRNSVEDAEKKFIQILEEQRKYSKGDYDCIIPVGGGKDSYWQVHKVVELGFDPLLVTYHGNNYLPEGQRNLDRMTDVFNCDHYIFHPGVETLIKLNRFCFKKWVI